MIHCETSTLCSDPCREKNCELGHECDIDDDGNAICVCMRSCPTENDSKVCNCHIIIIIITLFICTLDSDVKLCSVVFKLHAIQ